MQQQLMSLIDGLAAYRHLLRRVSWVLIALMAGSLVLEGGNWTWTQTVPGPFQIADDGSGRLIAPIGSFYLSIQPVRTNDVNSLVPQTSLQFRIKEEPFRGEGALNGVVRQRPLFGIGGLKKEILFVLPEGVANDQNLSLSVDCRIRLHRSLFEFFQWAFAISLLLSITVAYRSYKGVPPTVVRRIVPWLVLIFPTASWLLIAACSIYAATIAYGIYAGDALPTAMIFRLISTVDLTVIEFFAPYSILGIAALGSVFAWLATLHLVPATPLRRTEAALMRIWNWWGLPVVACLFLFSLSAGGWSGHIRTIDLNYMSLAGLAPNSDARGYFTDAFHQAFWGRWELMGSRRPVAEAFRQVTVFAAQYSYIDTLLIQLGLLVLVVFFATRAIASWRGIWAGLGFIGLIIILVRPFLATTLTEPLALIWGMFSLIFLIEALRLQSLPHALIGIAGLIIALLTRMGSLFTIPILVLWAAVVFARHSSARVRAFAIACSTVLLMGAVSLVLSYFYGSPRVLAGGNFAWTVCGLSMGTDWSGCDKAYASQFAQFSSEREIVWFLLGRSWENFLLNPSVLLRMLYINMKSFLDFPQFLLSGYSPNNQWLIKIAWLPTLMLVPGLIYALGWRASSPERLLWLALAISIPTSAAVVLGDDGWRVLYATHVFIACFFALGFAAPGVVTIPNSMVHAWSWQEGAAVIAVTIALFIAVPEVSRVLAMREVVARPSFEQPTNNNKEQIVLGGRRLTGFLVIPDAEPRPFAVPAIHLSQFVELVRMTRLEDEFGPFLQDVVGRTPFALVVGGRLDAENQSNIYIAPPIVLEQRDAWAWRFTLRVWLPSEVPWQILKEVMAVQRLP
jgi:hypothetical protein